MLVLKALQQKGYKKNKEKRKSYGNIWNTANRSIVTFFGKILQVFDLNIFRAQWNDVSLLSEIQQI